MLRHKNIDRLCCAVLACTLLLTCLYVGAATGGFIVSSSTMGYENRLFDQSQVHTIDIVMDDWDGFLSTCTNEEYTACHLVIDGESYKNVAIRAKGNTSLTSVAAYGNNRYSFKVEFDHYQKGKTYHGLDKLSLNNIIQDNTYMKDYLAYTLMNQMGVASPLCSFVQINVNGEAWGLYLAVEGVEEGFLQRNYGKTYGNLYKPDSTSFGAGRGNGRGFDLEDMAEKLDFTFDGNQQQSFTPPDMGDIPAMPNADDGNAPPEMPSAGNAPAMPDSAGGNTPPDMPSAANAPAMPDSADENTPPDMPDNSAGSGQRSFGGRQRDSQDFPKWNNKGGGFGMGSDDVKLLYSDDDPSSYTNIFDNAKTDITEEDKTRLIASLKALNEGDTSVVDTEAVIRYMVVHNFLCNGDSYTGSMVHNYYLYEKDGVLSMIPWDYNLAFGGFDAGSSAASVINASIDQLVTSGQTDDRPMADWITSSEEYLQQYHQVYQTFVSTLLDSGWLAQEIDRVTSMIAPYVESDPTAFCTYEEFQTGVQTLKTFCLKRAESISSQLSGENTQVDAAGIDLSDMGSMNKGKGMGADRQQKNFSFSGGDMPAFGDAPAAEGDAAPDMPASSDNPLLWLAGCALLLVLALLLAWRYHDHS